MIKKSRKKAQMTLAATAALLVGCSSSYSGVIAPKEVGSSTDMGRCVGINSCKGSSSCASSSNSCAQQNQCKGKGWLALNKQECADRKGRFLGFEK